RFSRDWSSDVCSSDLGTFVTAMQNPPTIHDFGGFPKELFEVQYPAPRDVFLAKKTQALITKTNVELDDKWGLDHGAWSVIKHLRSEERRVGKGWRIDR